MVKSATPWAELRELAKRQFKGHYKANPRSTRFLQGQFSALSLTTFPFNSLYMDRVFLVTLTCPDGQRRASREGRMLADSGGKLGIVHE